MQVDFIPFSEVPQLSDRDVAYATGDERLQPFYKYPVTLKAFAQVIEDKSKETIDRETLQAVVREQYQKLKVSDLLDERINSLTEETTFTVVTAHQPSLFTGPLYYIYKIISCINLAKQLNAAYPKYQFVPVFITGGEDHDFEEVQNVHIFNKTLTWESGETGSVGAMKTEKIHPLLQELQNILGPSKNAVEIYEKIAAAYSENDIYADATIQLVNDLFGKDGLLVINMSHPKLKRIFAPIIKEELIHQSSHPLVEATIEQLNEAGFKSQATPREINLFYLRDQLRERIIYEEGKYKILNTSYIFNEKELLDEVDQHPERFSPNVVMRPLFQEKVLPNLAYIGGGGELAYWLERQSQFAHFGINFPMLIRRNSVLWLDKGTYRKMDKLGLTTGDLFTETESLIKLFLKKISDEPLHLKPEKAQLEQMFEAIAEKIRAVDPTLEATVLAEGAKQNKSLEQLEGRLMRAEKQKHDVAVNQIRSLKEKLFLNNGLQERHDNFLSFYTMYGADYFNILKENLDPLRADLVVIQDV